MSLVRNVGAAIIGALLGGSSLVFLVNVKFQKKPYGYTILIVTVVFLLVIAFITLVIAVIMVPAQTKRPLSDPSTIAALQAFVTDEYPLKNALVWSFIVATTQLLLQVSSKFGTGTFWDMVTIVKFICTGHAGEFPRYPALISLGILLFLPIP